MVKFLYTVFDTVMEQCNQPFMANNDSHAVRIHMSSLKDIPTEFQADMKLFCIGTLDAGTMELGSVGKAREVPLLSVVDEEEVANA